MTLEPFLQELYRLFDLKMQQEAKLYCMGILNLSSRKSVTMKWG